MQVKLKRDLNEAAGKIEASSFISGLLPEDRITPVITLVILFSDKDWDAPRSIGELFEAYDVRLTPYIQDYKLNVIVPSEITDFDSFKTDLGLIIHFLKEMNDKNAIEKLLDDKNAEFRNMNYDAARLLGNFANLSLSNLEDAVTEKGDVNMCKAWDDHGKEEAAKAVAKNNKEWQEKTADLVAKNSSLVAENSNLVARNLILEAEIRQLRNRLEC